MAEAAEAAVPVATAVAVEAAVEVAAEVVVDVVVEAPVDMAAELPIVAVEVAAEVPVDVVVEAPELAQGPGGASPGAGDRAGRCASEQPLPRTPAAALASTQPDEPRDPGNARRGTSASTAQQPHHGEAVWSAAPQPRCRPLPPIPGDSREKAAVPPLPGEGRRRDAEGQRAPRSHKKAGGGGSFPASPPMP